VKREILRRYTDMPALIYLLSEKKLTLLDPESWDDSNDSHYLALYRDKRRLKSVLALCFTQADETYHHWRIFSAGPSGVCIRFKRAELLQAVRKQSGMRLGSVSYLTLPRIRNATLKTSQLPFLKRFAFEHEREFRMIFESNNTSLPKLDIAIPLSCIQRVTLSPWLHDTLSPHVKRALRAIDGCAKLDIARSTLIGNDEWKALGESSV
jgi:hypothetical protein